MLQNKEVYVEKKKMRLVYYAKPQYAYKRYVKIMQTILNISLLQNFTNYSPMPNCTGNLLERQHLNHASKNLQNQINAAV